MSRWVYLSGALSTGLFAVFLAWPQRPIRAAQSLPEAEFTKLWNAIRPAADEDAYDLIPWQTSLWAARKKAAEEGKPILLWEMDGHPLGCG